MSSYNAQTFDIINYSAASTFAFVENRIPPKKKQTIPYKITCKLPNSKLVKKRTI